jgi:hypothetical protein
VEQEGPIESPYLKRSNEVDLDAPVRLGETLHVKPVKVLEAEVSPFLSDTRHWMFGLGVSEASRRFYVFHWRKEGCQCD